MTTSDDIHASWDLYFTLTSMLPITFRGSPVYVHNETVDFSSALEDNHFLYVFSDIMYTDSPTSNSIDKVVFNLYWYHHWLGFLACACIVFLNSLLAFFTMHLIDRFP